MAKRPREEEACHPGALNPSKVEEAHRALKQRLHGPLDGGALPGSGSASGSGDFTSLAALRHAPPIAADGQPPQPPPPQGAAAGGGAQQRQEGPHVDGRGDYVEANRLLGELHRARAARAAAGGGAG